MRTLIDPPLTHWRLGRRPDVDRQSLGTLVQRADNQAPPALDAQQPILATGHQAWLWHPGILAKDLATVSAARRLGATPLHVVVDHDVLDPLRIDVPVQHNGRLTVQRIALGAASTALPTGAQPPTDAAQAVQALVDARDRLGDALAVDVQPLIDAIETASEIEHGSLAHQVSAWTAILMRPYCGDVPMLPASALLQTDIGRDLLRAMLSDARGCVRAYNEAVHAHGDAGVPPLLVERERVELPVWALQWQRPRQRVFADLADSVPMLTLEDGTPLPENERWLAPRALLLTALMRSRFCELFVHGKGGGVYDRATEQWWQSWHSGRGEALAPMAVVSADAYLSFDVPTADGASLQRAVWYRHHARYNVDRLAHANGPLSAQKQRLIERMHALPTRRARWLAFREIRRFNDELAAAHPGVLDAADRQLAEARAGLVNARIANRRDWCFALYPPATLEALHAEIDRAAPVCP